MILLLVLRRSMLHALGFTYADLLPLHRGMGFAIIFWSTAHTGKLLLDHFLYCDLIWLFKTIFSKYDCWTNI
jgi:hypothetical protein